MRPFVQRGKDRSGLGFGLSICVKAAQSMDGELRVRDVPGTGCVFTLDLPRKTALHPGDATNGAGGSAGTGNKTVLPAQAPSAAVGTTLH